MEKYYVVIARDDVGEEFNTWEEAARRCSVLKQKGYEPIILGPDCDPGDDNDPSWA